MFESVDGWADQVLVRVLPAPPPERITSPGGRRASVSVPGQGGHTVTNTGVVLAWAPMANRDWAMLFLWSGWRRIEGRCTLSARWSWCTVGRTQVYVFVPVRDGNPWGLAWYGNRSPDLDAATAEAVASLPEPMRHAAARPVPRDGELWLNSLNPRIVR